MVSLADIDAVFLDCDGTLYTADEPVPGAPQAVAALREQGKQVFFVTNTSARSAEQLCAKLEGLGIPCAPRECVPSGAFAAAYLAQAHPGAHFLVIGGDGLVQELRKQSLEAEAVPPGGAVDAAVFAELVRAVRDGRYDGVVVGYDAAFSYRSICMASLVFETNPHAVYFATNDDDEDVVLGHRLPATGTLLQSLNFVARHRTGAGPRGRTPVVLGKPNPLFAEFLAKREGLRLRRVLMVGDRLDTDIAMADAAGMPSVLVRTGVHSERDITGRYGAGCVVLDSVCDLLPPPAKL